MICIIVQVQKIAINHVKSLYNTPIANHCTMFIIILLILQEPPQSEQIAPSPRAPAFQRPLTTYNKSCAITGYTGVCEVCTMDRDTLLEATNTIKAGDRCENACWLTEAANALAHELIYANNGQVGKYDAWQVASMIEAATNAAMMEVAILSEYLCDEAREKAEKANQQREGYAPKN